MESDEIWKPLGFYVYIMSCHVNPVIMRIQMYGIIKLGGT